MACRGYRFSIEWIALNDEPDEFDEKEVANLISVLLVADMFYKDPSEVAKAVVKYRKKVCSQFIFQ